MGQKARETELCREVILPIILHDYSWDLSFRLSHRKCVSGIVLIRFVFQIVFDQKFSLKFSYGYVCGLRGRDGVLGGIVFLSAE